MAAEEDTVAWDNLTRLELENVTNDNIVNRHESGLALTKDLDVALFLFCVELLELALLLVVVDGTNKIDDDNGDENGHTFDPIDLSRVAKRFDTVANTSDLLGRCSKIGIETKGQRDDGGDTKENEDLVLQCEPHEKEKTVGLAFRERVLAEDADSVLLGSIDEVGVAPCNGIVCSGCALDIV